MYQPFDTDSIDDTDQGDGSAGPAQQPPAPAASPAPSPLARGDNLRIEVK